MIVRVRPSLTPSTDEGIRALTPGAARFDLDRQTEQGVERELGADPAETLAKLRQVAHLTGTPLDSRLVEEVLHGEDIGRPLGIRRTYAPEAVVRSLHYLVRTPDSVGGAKRRVAGLRLRATDADISIGDGPEVVGPALSLLTVVSGRLDASDELDGDGLSRLS